VVEEFAAAAYAGDAAEMDAVGVAEEAVDAAVVAVGFPPGLAEGQDEELVGNDLVRVEGRDEPLDEERDEGKGAGGRRLRWDVDVGY